MATKYLRSKKKQKELGKAVNSFLARFPPQDMLIMTAGFVAGTQGYTPLSAILGNTGSTAMKEQAANQALTLGMATLNPIVLIAGILNRPSEQAKTEDQKLTEKDLLMKMFAMGTVGMVEAYTVTRPGTIAGIGEIVKGVGEIIPG